MHLAFQLLAITMTAQLTPGDHDRTLIVGELKRSYIIHIPKTYDGTKATPVVLAYHGGGSNAKQMVTFCGLNDTADKHGFIVVYPNGTGRLEKRFLQLTCTVSENTDCIMMFPGPQRSSALLCRSHAKI